MTKTLKRKLFTPHFIPFHSHPSTSPNLIANDSRRNNPALQLRPHRSLGQLSVVLATACMYIMWATCFLHQLHPLVRPIKGMH